ncbi:MAG: hypothetical protein KDI30_07745, partial [Pseudomonadales bacterium]|nr:hypothetical protein [Pseudomonadales bacterium]
MLYTLLMIAFLFLALLILFISFKFLVKISWFLGWIRGNAGLLFLVLSVAFALTGYDFRHFKPVPKEKPVLTVSFQKKADNAFMVTLSDESGSETRQLVNGEEWIVFADTLNWSHQFSGIGFTQGYRFKQFSTRLKESGKTGSEDGEVLSLKPESLFGVDAWQVVSMIEQFLPVVQAGTVNPG